MVSHLVAATVLLAFCQRWLSNKNAALANKDLLDHPDLSDLTAKMVQMAKMALTVNLEKMVLFYLEVDLRQRLARNVRLDPQDPLEKKDPKADQDLRASLAIRELLELRANVEPLDHEALLVTLANPDPKALPVMLANRSIRKDHLVDLDLKDLRVTLEHPDLLAHQANPVMLDLLEKLEMQVMLVPTVRTAVPAHKDLLDPVEPQAAVAIAHQPERRPATTPRIRSRQLKHDIPKRTNYQSQTSLARQHYQYLLILSCSSEGFCQSLLLLLLIFNFVHPTGFLTV